MHTLTAVVLFPLKRWSASLSISDKIAPEIPPRGWRWNMPAPTQPYISHLLDAANIPLDERYLRISPNSSCYGIEMADDRRPQEINSADFSVGAAGSGVRTGIPRFPAPRDGTLPRSCRAIVRPTALFYALQPRPGATYLRIDSITCTL